MDRQFNLVRCFDHLGEGRVDSQVKGFIIETRPRPDSASKNRTQNSLKVVQKGLITLKDCRVSEENRLQGGNSFRDNRARPSHDALYGRLGVDRLSNGRL